MPDDKGKGKAGGKKILGMPRTTGLVVLAAGAAGVMLLLLWLKNRNATGQQQQPQTTGGTGGGLSGGGFATGGGQSSFLEMIKSTGGHQGRPWPVDKPPREHRGGKGEHRGRHDAGTLGGSAHSPKG